MKIDWSEKRPIEPGMYIFKSNVRWQYHLKIVRKGNWEMTQNPDELYAGDDLISSLEGEWFGPIPECKSKSLAGDKE